jgi:hypothetical protein
MKRNAAAIAVIAALLVPGDEKAIKAARESALDALAPTDENVKKGARLDAYRGARAAPNR